MKKMTKKLITLLALLLLGLSLVAQRQMETLDRGLVAVKTTKGVFLSWRLTADEWYDVTYNVYRDGTKLNDTPLEVSNYSDNSGSISSKYTVSTIVKGVEQAQSDLASPWAKQYKEITLVDRPDDYEINDATAADLDGDGEYEIIVKRLNRSCAVSSTLFTYFEAYKQDGTFLWEINVGPNILSSGGVEINIAAFDLDEDGKAEVFMRTSEGTIFGDGTEIGDVDADGKTNYRYSVIQSSNMEYMNEGPEFLSLIDGETGVELDRVDYIPRGKSEDWGDNYGHRANKFFFGAPYLDGKKPSLFIGRGIYSKTQMCTYDIVDKKMVLRWKFSSNDFPGFAYQGNHNYTIADVDEDGRDEIVWGGMCVDDDGTGLYTTGFGHGDALHVGDLDPFRKGAEVWRCVENSPVYGTVLCDGATGDILIHQILGRDCGRCCAANISDDIKGKALWGSQNVFSASTKEPVSTSTGSVNYRIYWDGDLLEELLDHNWDGDSGEGKIHKPNVGNLLVASGTNSCNWTKGTPALQADLLGDWREEVIWRTADDTKIRIYTTTDATPYRNYTLMHDHQYRQAICWQMCGYNQPPHVSYFLGEGEGMTVPPPPSTTNGRLVYQGNSDWDKTSNAWKKDNVDLTYVDGEHVHFDVLNGLDAKVNLKSKVLPSNMTVNSPGDYTIDASAGSLSGPMGLMKQGLGTLDLNGNHDYSGDTEIWNGRLDFDGTLSNSHIWVNLFGEFSADGTLGKGVTMRYGSSLFVGKADDFGTLLIKDSLSVEEQAKLVFDIQSSSSKDNDILTVEGDLILQDGASVFIVPHLADGEERLAPGEYILAEVSGEIIANLNELTIDGILGTPAQLKIKNNSIVLEIIAMRDAATVAWSGQNSNIWDLATTPNFLYNGTVGVFVTDDILTFNDQAVQKNISIKESVSPVSVMVDASSNFSFSGEGAISGGATLTKKGTGVLTISNVNTFTGKVSLNEGTLKVYALPNDIADASPIGPVSSDANLFVIDGGELVIAEASSMDRAMTIGSKGATINALKQVKWNSLIKGDTLFKTGPGEIVFDYGNTHKNITIKEGVVRLLDDNALPGGSVTFEGGTLKCCNSTGSYSSLRFPLHVAEGQTGTIHLDGRANHYNVLTGKGELTVVSPFIRSDFNGDWSNFEGIINFTGDGCRINNSYGYGKAIVNIAYGMTAEHLSNKTVAIGTLAGKGSLGNSIWEVGGRNEDFIFGGEFKSGTLKKVGTGTMTLTAASSNLTNTVQVLNGTLLANSFMSSTFGDANVSVKSGAYLGGAGKVDGSVIVQSGGTLYAGNPDVVASSLKVGKVTLYAGSHYQVNLNTETKKTNKTTVSGAFYANGELILNEVSGNGFQPGQRFIIVASDQISGSFTSIVPAVPGVGMEWDLSEFQTKGVIQIPEVSALNSANAELLKVYPNAANDHVIVEFPCLEKDMQLRLISLSGQVLKEATFSNVEKVEWDVSECVSGVYLVSLVSDGEMLAKKITLKH